MNSRYWARLLGMFGLASMAVQGFGFIASIIWVRTMTVEEYALFSLCLAAVSTGAVLGDLGISASLGYFWRRALQRGEDVAPFIFAAFTIRRSLSIMSGSFVLTCLVGLLLYRSVSFDVTIVSAVLVSAMIWLGLDVSFASSVLRLKNRIVETLWADIVGALIRLAGAGLAMLLAYSVAIVGLCTNIAGAIGSLLILRRVERAPVSSGVDHKDERAQIIAYLLPTLPSMLLYAFKDQILIWVAWFSGGADPVAATYALGRLAVLFTLAGTFATTIFMPKLAQVKDNRRFLAIAGSGALAMSAISAAMIVLAVFQPDFILALLGKNYVDLQSELVVSLLAAGMTTVAIFLAQVNRLRGWVRMEPFVASLYLASIIIAVVVGQFETPMGVLVANCWLAAFGLATVLITTTLGAMGVSFVVARTPMQNGS